MQGSLGGWRSRGAVKVRKSPVGGAVDLISVSLGDNALPPLIYLYWAIL